MEEKIIIGERDALTIIDLQNDFTRPDSALFVKGVEGEATMEQIIKRVSRFIKMPFGRLVATQDSHPDNHIEFSIFGKHCEMGEQEIDFITELDDVINCDFIIKGREKNVFSYAISTSKEFLWHIDDLRQDGIKRIFLCGLAYNYCVGESAIDYARQGFEVFVIRDATRSIPPPYGKSDNMTKKLELYGVKLINFDDLISE